MRTIRPAGIGVLAALVLGTAILAQESGQRRVTPAEISALPAASGGTGTSGLAAVTTRILFGDPNRSGPYSIELTVAPNTTIAAHAHRDTRSAVVTRGLWFFGYGPTHRPELLKALPPGSFYTEPGGDAHFARTGEEGATVIITGFGPSDTVYTK